MGTEPIPGIYVLSDETGPVYVGQSGDVRRRLAQHRAEGRKRFHDARVYQILDLPSRLLTEAALTALLHPKYNDGIFLGLKNPIGGGRRVWEMDRRTIYRKRKPRK